MGQTCDASTAHLAERLKVVKWNLRDLEAVLNRAIRAVATLGIFGAKVTGIADARIWSRSNAIRDVAE